MNDRPADFSSVVKANWDLATAYLLAGRRPCIEIRDDEVGRIGSNRKLVALNHGELDRIDFKGIWVLGVVVCPGEHVEDVLAWVRAHPVEPWRIWFFLHAATDMTVLEPWVKAGFRPHQVDVVEDWMDLQAVFGLYLNDIIYEARGPTLPRDWKPGRRRRAANR